MTPETSTHFPQHLEWKGWSLFHFENITSTNDLAREANPWSVLIAESQSEGRGRYGRAWEANPGGLWFSVVLPLDERIDHWAALPLMVGLSLSRSLSDHGLKGIRLRWPNDLMIGDQKIAGLLVERVSGARGIIGVGINITNDPAEGNPELEGIATRLADHVQPVPDPGLVLRTFLDHLHQNFTIMQENGFRPLAAELDPFWDRSRPVTLTLDNVELQGRFEGVNENGALLLRDHLDQLHILEPNRVTLFRDHGSPPNPKITPK
jgi:BirA family biotin operon repressor/biotin-[acetyl-CoA-carboxylase] ligase